MAKEKKNSSLVRLDKYLSRGAIVKRSEVSGLVRKNRITVNEKIIKDPGTKINPDTDTVRLDNKVINYNKFEYIMMNKPSGVISALSDNHDKTVMDLIDFENERHNKNLSIVGRLDKDTEGLLIITNDGDFNHKMLSPLNHVDKEYICLLAAIDDKMNISDILTSAYKDKIIADFKKGIDFKEFTSKEAEIQFIDKSDEVFSYESDYYKSLDKDNTAAARVRIHEGKYHQVKRMFEHFGLKVLYLKRISFGNIELDNNLKAGEYKNIDIKDWGKPDAISSDLQRRFN